MNDLLTQFVHRLAEDLLQPLPGRAGQYRMAPRPRPGGEFVDPPRADARRGSVLMLFYPHAQQLYLPLILRPDYGGVHSGQIALPGGGWEDGDADMVATALREAHEEIGVEPQAVTVLGALTPLYVGPSNFLVHPIVGWLPHRPTFRLDPHEVAELIEAPLSALLNPDNLQVEEWQLRDRTAMVPFYRIQQHRVWGATAMMLCELLALPALATLADLANP
jgi:8-oxo-dGTP pyrophosphatase MutT (NUDIX family)